MKLEEVKKRLLKNPNFRKEYERFDLIFELQQLWTRFKIWVRSI